MIVVMKNKLLKKLVKHEIVYKFNAKQLKQNKKVTSCRAYLCFSNHEYV